MIISQFFFLCVQSWKLVDNCGRIRILEFYFFVDQRMSLVILWFSSSPLCQSWKFIDSCIIDCIMDSYFLEKNWNTRTNASCHFEAFHFFFLRLSIVDSCYWNNRGLFLYGSTNVSCHCFSLVLYMYLLIVFKRIFELWSIVIFQFSSLSIWKFIDRFVHVLLIVLWITTFWKRIGILELCFFVDQRMSLVILWFSSSPLSVNHR